MTHASADLAAFITASPSSYHAVAEVARRLWEAGFVEQDADQPFSAEEARYVISDGAIIAWRVPERIDGATAFRVVGSHTDSPGFKLKPQPSLFVHGWSQVGMEVYGGPLLNSWLDREFGLAGRIVTTTGEVRLVSTPPWLRIPQLAPHLDRSVNDSLQLDRQAHLLPVTGVGPCDILEAVADHAGVQPGDIDGHDLFAAVAEPPAVIGVHGDMLASWRLDNLSSVHASATALIAAGPPATDIQVLVAFDHEEIGSATRTGAQGPLLEFALHGIADALGWDGGGFRSALARSFVISADAGHSVHPNYAHLHDPGHRLLMNGGPLLKVNANQRYTTEGPSTARWRRICRAADVPTQPFVSNNAVPCGSTIGPFVASRLGMASVDVGVPLLSMHSARELVGLQDQAWLIDALTAFYGERE
jgi:aspartyl aminopeptidase